MAKHSFPDDSREALLRFLDEIVYGLAESIDKSLLMPNGIHNVEELLDGKLLRKHGDAVLKAIDAGYDPIERGDAFHGTLQIVMASIQIGLALAATTAKRRTVDALSSALMARRSTSEKIDSAIAALAGPLKTKHPTWRPGRVANEIADPLNKQLATLGLPILGPDAIRKRVQKPRTNVRASDT